MPRLSTGGFGAYSVKRLCTTSCKPYLAQPMPMRRAMRGAPAVAVSPGWGLQRLARTIVFYDLVGRFGANASPRVRNSRHSGSPLAARASRCARQVVLARVAALAPVLSCNGQPES